MSRLAALLVAAAATLAAAAVLVAASVALGRDPTSSAPPAQVLERYLRAMYARDFAAAYAEISPADRRIKPRPVYLAENPPLERDSLALAQALAQRIAITGVVSRSDGERATVTFRAALPDANAPAVAALTERFDAASLARLAPGERARRRAALAALAASPALPMIDSPREEWQLVHAAGRWWVDLDWAGAVSVRFDGVVLGGLPWRFAPAQREVRARPGETLQVAYRLTNPTAEVQTGKARHVVAPRGEGVLDIVTCFCFLEQTLEPGQTVELPVVFRVPFDAPEALREINVRYEFYPAAAFPGPGAS